MNPAKRTANWLRFQLERLVLRGPHYRLLVVALLIVLVAVAFGLLASWIARGFDSSGDAVWWAFLRLTDPGYLGDDDGAARRTISTAVTIIGYVIFMGALIAIMTQWFHATMDRLGAGLTPIVESNHVVILGWSNRTPTVVEQLLLSEGRVRRFLGRIGEKRLTVAILAEEVGPELLQELKDRLGTRWSPRQIIVRSGTALRLEHLRRVDFLHAAVIVMPGADLAEGEGTSADGRAIKPLLRAGTAAREAGAETLPTLVAELSDARNVPIAERAYGGPIEVIAADQMLARLLAQNLRHPGLSHVFNELLTHDEGGNEVYLRDAASLAGLTFGDLIGAFPRAVPLGLARERDGELETLLRPAADLEVLASDRVVVMARSYEESLPAAPPERRPEEDTEAEPLARRSRSGARRILVLGWSRKVPALVHELDCYDDERYEVDILSRVPGEDRGEAMDRADAAPERVTLRQIEGEYTSASDLAALGPSTYAAVVLVASDWLDSESESDARTVLGYLVLGEALSGAAERPRVIVELADPENVALFASRADEVIVSPVILSHVLTQVALRRELGPVFDEIFGPGGAEIFFRPAADYGLAGREATFEETQRAAEASGHLALGLRIAAEASGSDGGIVLNPPHGRPVALTAEDELVVLLST